MPHSGHASVPRLSADDASKGSVEGPPKVLAHSLHRRKGVLKRVEERWAKVPSVGARRFLRTPGIIRPMDLPDELSALQSFHGHLGVYVTLGLRMGAIGKRRFGHYKGLSATVRSRPEPPMRCVLDGIQFSSGCTMGKGNIALEAGSEPEVDFEKDGRRLRISLRSGWRERIDREMSKDKELEQSLYYYEIPEREVFEIWEG